MSKTTLRKAYYSIRETMSHAALSYQSTNDYQQILRLMLQQLHDAGFTLTQLSQLKQKHVDSLLVRWQAEQLSAGTIKNRLSVLRLTAQTLGKHNLIKSNTAYGIAGRRYIPEVSKGIHHIDFEKISNAYVRISLELQRAFGLRREECIKFKPHQADKGDVIHLQGSWTKGGIARIVPITTAEQRDCLARAKALVGKSLSLIPSKLSYKDQRVRYDNAVRLAGIKNPHGLRHAYAQQRYETLTHQLTKGYGWKAPVEGGPGRRTLNPYEKKVDEQVRMMIGQELGHSRVAITRSYLDIGKQ